MPPREISAKVALQAPLQVITRGTGKSMLFQRNYDASDIVPLDAIVFYFNKMRVTNCSVIAYS